MRTLLCIALSVVAVPQAAADVFAYDVAGRHFEAEVSPETLTLREKRDGSASDSAALACPLGSAVRANTVPLGAGGGRVCLVFSKQQCTGPDTRTPPRNAGGSFRCIEFTDANQAAMLTRLINAGPQPEAPAQPASPAAAASTAASLAKPGSGSNASASPASPSSAKAKSSRSSRKARAAAAKSDVPGASSADQASGTKPVAPPSPAADLPKDAPKAEGKRGQTERAQRVTEAIPR